MNGWAPASVTYSPDGEVLSVTVQEPRFTPSEKAVLLAARRKALEPRGSHGFTFSEATDRANLGKFVVPMPLTDLASKALREAEESWKSQHGSDSTRDLIFRVELDRD